MSNNKELVTVSLIILFVIIFLGIWLQKGSFPQSTAFPHHHYQLDSVQLEKKEVGSLRRTDQKYCDWLLNKKPEMNVQASRPINERPSYVDFHPSCQSNPVPNPDLAMSGTGVGIPAYADVNEFPAEYEKSVAKCCNTNTKSVFEPQARDEFGDDSFGSIDYEVNIPRIGGVVCKRNTGIGRPSFENEGDTPAPY